MKKDVIVCPTCSYENSTEETVCIQCKRPLPASAPKGVTKSLHGDEIATVQVADQPARLARIEHAAQLTRTHRDAIALFIMGESEPLLVKGRGKTILGRHIPGERPPTVDLTNYGAHLLGVSRQHALVSFINKRYTIEDLASTNGTWLNENKLTPFKAYVLRNGDQVRLGQLTVYAYFNSAVYNEQTIFLVETDDGRETSSKLTPDHLVNNISPYLNAIAQLQHIIDEAADRAHSEVQINTISASVQHSHIRVAIDGVPDAINLVKAAVLPWRKQQVNHLPIYRKVEKLTEAETELSGGESDAKRQRQDLARALFQLANDMLSQAVPDLSADNKKVAIKKMFPSLQVVSLGTVELASEETVPAPTS
jgi:hypothetical protein